MHRFFVSGYNKSGTTFLQMLLDAHPTIHCPSEHHLNTLSSGFAKISKQYRLVIETFDERTAQQGICFDEGQFSSQMFQAALEFLFTYSVPASATHAGINDNSLIENAVFLAQVMPKVRFVFIVRDPRDIGISLWHHRRRTEDDFAKSGIQLKKIVIAVAGEWATHIKKLRLFEKDHHRQTVVVRYEDLIDAGREAHLARILTLLDVEREQSTLDAMFSATEFTKLRAKENYDAANRDSFFRSGKSNIWRATLDNDTADKCLLVAQEELKIYGYIQT